MSIKDDAKRLVNWVIRFSIERIRIIGKNLNMMFGKSLSRDNLKTESDLALKRIRKSMFDVTTDTEDVWVYDKRTDGWYLKTIRKRKKKFVPPFDLP